MYNNNCVSRLRQRLINEWFFQLEEQGMNRQEQAAFLKHAGLISEKEELLCYLNNIGLTTLKPYLCNFLLSDGFAVRFQKGTTWNDVYNLYQFDNNLRSLIYLGIWMFEMAFREQISYHLESKYGPYWQNDSDLFKEPRPKRLKDDRIEWIDVYADIQKVINLHRHNDKRMCTFRSLQHLFYFSFYSRIYSHLQERVDQEHIAWHFYVPFYTFCSWAHTLVKIRNLCAHNEHLWNRSFTVTADELMYSNKLYWMSDSSTVERNKVYYILCILNFLL